MTYVLLIWLNKLWFETMQNWLSIDFIFNIKNPAFLLCFSLKYLIIDLRLESRTYLAKNCVCMYFSPVCKKNQSSRVKLS